MFITKTLYEYSQNIFFVLEFMELPSENKKKTFQYFNIHLEIPNLKYAPFYPSINYVIRVSSPNNIYLVFHISILMVNNKITK